MQCVNHTIPSCFSSNSQACGLILGSVMPQDVPSMAERYNSLPRLKLEPAEDPMQQGDAPMSAPARSTGLLELAGASPHAHGRSTGVHDPDV